MLLQIIITVLVMAILWEIFSKYRHKELSLFSVVFWAMIWISILIVVWHADITSVIADFLNIQRGIDSVVYLSIVTLFYLVFRLLLKIEEIERKLEKIVRENSLKSKK